jgi:uncharacterized integral membrane protein (TIGR00698 family)
VNRLFALAPGLVLAVALALAGHAIVLALPKLPVSGVTLAILLGLLLANLTALPAAVAEGTRFAVTHILRAGIVLLGLRLSFVDVASIGSASLPLVVVTIVAALLIAASLGRALQVPTRLATLIGVGTGICGATAIVATSPLIGARNAETGYAVACIVLCGLAGMLVYPLLAQVLFAGDPLRTGLFLGAAIPDTAQVIGAGMAYRDYTGDARPLEVATVTKMTRNLMMLLVIPLLAISSRRAAAEDGRESSVPRWHEFVPLFVLGFAAMSLLRTLGDAGAGSFAAVDPQAWRWLIETARLAADLLLATAMAALGLSTRLASLRELGARPLWLAFACMLGLALVAFLGVELVVAVSEGWTRTPG